MTLLESCLSSPLSRSCSGPAEDGRPANHRSRRRRLDRPRHRDARAAWLGSHSERRRFRAAPGSGRLGRLPGQRPSCDVGAIAGTGLAPRYPRWIQLAGCGDKSGTNSRLETFLLSETGEGSSRSMRFPWPVIHIHGPLRVTGSARVSGQRLGAGANGLPADTLALIDRRAKYGYCLLRKVAEGPSWILDGDKMSHSF